VITRLYNMWAGMPDPTIDRNPAVLDPLKRFASRRPFFKGVAPPGHPYSWLFDGIECKDAPHLSLDELRHDQVRPLGFRGLGLVVARVGGRVAEEGGAPFRSLLCSPLNSMYGGTLCVHLLERGPGFALEKERAYRDC
jgi:hypothetical protein